MKKLFALMFFSLLLISLVSAMDWDNVKSFDIEKNEITIKNALGLPLIGSNLAKYKLISNTDECLINCKATGNATLYTEGKLFSDMNFYDKKENTKTIPYKIYVTKNISYEHEVEEMEEVCHYYKDNSSKICHHEIVNTYNETRYKLEEMEYNGEDLEAGNYSWKIEGRKGIFETLDWRGSAFGEVFEEWAWWNTNWDYKQPLTINSTVASTLTDFIITLEVDTASLISAGKLQADCDDLRFINSTEDGELYYEVENNTCNRSDTVVFVKIPSFASGNQTIYMYYDNAGASDGSDAGNVWSDYEFVYHFADLIDSAGNHNLTKVGTWTQTHQEGELGQVLTLGTDYSDNGDYLNITGGILDFEVNFTTSFYGSFSNINVDAQNLFLLEQANNVGCTTIQYREGIISAVYTANSQNPNNQMTTSGFTATTNTYYKLGLVFDESAQDGRMYVNGILNATDTSFSTGGTNYYSSLGASTRTGCAYGGLFEGNYTELRMRNKFNTADWVKAEFGSNYFFGVEEDNDNSPTVTQNSPVDEYNSTSASVTLNCTVTDDIGLENVTFYVDDVPKNTNSSGINNSFYTYTHTFPQGSSDWICGACDNVSQCTNSSARTINVDSVMPSINITYPFNNSLIDYHEVNTNLQFNWTATDDNIGACWLQLFNGTNQTLTCNVNTTNVNITNVNNNNLTLWVNDTFGNYKSLKHEWDYQVFQNSEIHNNVTWETGYETFTVNATANSSLTGAYLVWDGTPSEMTTIATGVYQLNKSIATVGGLEQNDIYYNFTYAGGNITSNTYEQYVNATNFTWCDGTLTSMFLNITFKDEASGTDITASLPSATFEYYLGNGSVSKTLSYINNSINGSFGFCAYPSDQTFYVNPTVQYVNGSTYPQRVWQPATQTYTNTTTNQTLYLLAADDGLYVTFQVLSLVGSPIEGVTVTAVREIAGVNTTVGNDQTDAAGTVTFWLNPDFQHYFNFTKTLYNPYFTKFAPTQASYTVTLSSTSGVTLDYLSGVISSITPTNTSLVNDTIYTFTYNVTSTAWVVQQFGFNLRLSNGTIVGTDSSAVEGTPASVNYNTTNISIIYMDYYYKINNTFVNGSKYWVVYNNGNVGFSIWQFFKDFKAYLATGIFGLDDFGVNLIIFLVLALSMGVMSYKYGLTSPFAVSAMIFIVVFFFDVVVDVLPDIAGKDNLLTFLAAVILVVSIFREVQR